MERAGWDIDGRASGPEYAVVASSRQGDLAWGLPERYRSIVADSSRWDGFVFRPGDVVISALPKCGTTWTQMLFLRG